MSGSAKPVSQSKGVKTSDPACPQSPAINAPANTPHRRRSRTLGAYTGQRATIKPPDHGVIGPDHQLTNLISFGSVDKAPAIAPTPMAPTEEAKRPGPLSATPPVPSTTPAAASANSTTHSSTSTLKPKKVVNIYTLFQGRGGASAPSDAPAEETLASTPPAPPVPHPHYPQHPPHMQPKWGQQPYYYPQGFDPYQHHYWQQQQHHPHAPHPYGSYLYIGPHIYTSSAQPSPVVPSKPHPPSAPPLSAVSPAPGYTPTSISTHAQTPASPSASTPIPNHSSPYAVIAPDTRPRTSTGINTPDATPSPQVNVHFDQAAQTPVARLAGGKEKEQNDHEKKEDMEQLKREARDIPLAVSPYNHTSNIILSNTIPESSLPPPNSNLLDHNLAWSDRVTMPLDEMPPQSLRWRGPDQHTTRAVSPAPTSPSQLNNIMEHLVLGQEGEGGKDLKLGAASVVSKDDIEQFVEVIKLYSNTGDVDKGLEILQNLPEQHRPTFIERCISLAFDNGTSSVQFFERLFAAAYVQRVCSPKTFDTGLRPAVESADDTSMDVPRTYEWLARLMYAAGLTKARVERMAEQILVIAEPKIPPKYLLLYEYEKMLS